jgi:hypothetical protein
MVGVTVGRETAGESETGFAGSDYVENAGSGDAAEDLRDPVGK